MSELLQINVNDHIEKKNGLSYLSWAWAWAEVLRIDPHATWEAHERDGVPAIWLPDGSALVRVTVTIKAHSKTCWLPVMNHRNQAVKNPDAFAVNTAIVRCLVKCIALHGLGLYIYAGEDLPEATRDAEKATPQQPSTDALAEGDGITDVELIACMREATSIEALRELAQQAKLLPEEQRPEVRKVYSSRMIDLAEDLARKREQEELL